MDDDGGDTGGAEMGDTGDNVSSGDTGSSGDSSSMFSAGMQQQNQMQEQTTEQELAQKLNDSTQKTASSAASDKIQ